MLVSPKLSVLQIRTGCRDPVREKLVEMMMVMMMIMIDDGDDR